jgi:hypothetical protein
MEMRKLITILALLGLATGFTALTASADTVTYMVKGTFSADPILPSTSQSNVGDMFTLSFSVDSGALGTSAVSCPPNLCMSQDITPVSFVYTDITTPSLSLDGTCAPMAPCGTVNFFTPGNGGLFMLVFSDSAGNTFTFELVAEGCFISTLPAQCGGFTNETPPTLITGGPFTIDDTLSALGEASPSCVSIVGPFCADDISGTVTATSSTAVPEPSSLLLLGSGFLALGGFARKRLVTLFN